METVHVTHNGIQFSILVQMIKASDIPEEEFFVQQPGQLVTLRIPYQVTVFRQFYAFRNTGLDDLDIRIRFRDEVHGSDLQAVQFGLLVNGQNNHRDGYQILIDLHLGNYFAPAFIWHLQVKKQQVDLLFVAAQYFKRFDAIRSAQDIILIPEEITHHFAVHFHIIGNKNTFSRIDDRNNIGNGVADRHVVLRCEGLLQQLLSLVHGLVSFFKDAQQTGMTVFIILDHAGRDGFSYSDLRAVLWQGIDLFHQFCSLTVILPGQKDHKLISSDTEYRAVAENAADLRAGISDAYVSFLMSVQVINHLQIIDVANHYGKRLPRSFFDFLVYLLFPLHIGVLVFDACQGINGCHLSGCREITGVFLLLSDLCVFVEQADDEQRFSVLLNLRGFQLHITRKIAAHQAVVHHKYPVPLNGGQDILFCDL